MKPSQIMQEYQKVIDYFRTPIIDYLSSLNIQCVDENTMKKLYYAFFEICNFEDLYIPMLNNENQKIVIERELKKHSRSWKKYIEKSYIK